jgi:hypothetical protein
VSEHRDGAPSDEHREEPPSDEHPDQSGISDLPGLAGFAVMGTTIATCEAVGVVLGLWADHSWGTAPVGLVIGIVLGTVAAVVSVVKQVRRFL